MSETFTVLDVRLHGEHVGTLVNFPGDRNFFSFAECYIQAGKRPTLSLSFQDEEGNLLQTKKTVRTRLPPFFSNLLPEGPMRRYLASHADANPEREFYLLKALGRDLPGALQVVPVTEVVLSKDYSGAVSSFMEEDEEALRFSLAGVQIKLSAIQDTQGRLTIPAHGVGGSWIVKFPSREFPQVPENEFAMMELARKIAIEVPETALLPIEKVQGVPTDLGRYGSHVFAIKRFDRTDDGRAVHMEDFAQVFGLYPEKKYRAASYRNIAEVLFKEIGQEAIVEFMRRFIFSVLIGNGDMHLKNWSLIYPDKVSASLSPAYDFVSTLPYIPQDRLALNFVDSKDFESVTIEQIKRFAAKANLPEKLLTDTAVETVERFHEVWQKDARGLLDKQLYTVLSQHLKRLEPLLQIKSA